MRRALFFIFAAVLASAVVGLAQPKAGVEAAASERRARPYVKATSFDVTVGEIEDAANAQTLFTRLAYRRRANLRKIANDLVDFELLAAQAEKRGFGKHPHVRRATDERAIEALIEREIDARITSDSITEEQIGTYFQSHRAELARPELVRASHLLVETQADAAALRKTLAEASAQQFREAARGKSLDPETNLRGGDLGFFDADGRAPQGVERSVDSALAAAAFALDAVGDLSAPIAVGERWSIVRLTGRQAARDPKLEEVASTIREALWLERRRAAIDELLETLRQRTKPTVNPQGADAIELDSSDALPGLASPRASDKGSSAGLEIEESVEPSAAAEPAKGAAE